MNGKLFGKQNPKLAISWAFQRLYSKLSVNLTLPFSGLFWKKHGETALKTSNSYASVRKTLQSQSRSLEGLFCSRFSGVFRQTSFTNHHLLFAVLRNCPSVSTALLPHIMKYPRGVSGKARKAPSAALLGAADADSFCEWNIVRTPYILKGKKNGM